MRDVGVAEGWIWSRNVGALLHLLSIFVGYKADDWDRGAVEAGLAPTDARRSDGWFAYPIEGQPRLDLSLANDLGSDVVRVRIEGLGDASLLIKAEVILLVLSEYELIDLL